AILRQTGAKSFVIAATHAVLCAPAIERLAAAPVDRILATDSVPQDRANLPSNMEICSVAPLIAQAIRNIHLSESVSSLFE
ncbi:MAG TPA: ribose-phosphate diphosphokinase, partial [Planctomycetota bacterium]|nr:ribose-phosphate diphosphokinase [Planctomycetota bacterium]